ncbi:MAG: DUF4292 domain-containing protein [Chitinophagaceae bacterium]|nr:DUF4292 domain-containing protein [Chitinophagaceae bacterium]
MIKFFFAAIACIIILAGCKTTSKVTTASKQSDVKNNASQAMLDSLEKHAFRFEWFTGKAKVEILQGTDKTEFTANLRIRNDSAIWVSISPALGLEVARVLLTKDSIRIIDRLNNDYDSKDYHFFKTFTSFPITYDVVQDLIEGTPLFINNREFNVDRTDSTYSLKWEQSSQTNLILLDHKFLEKKQTVTDSTTASMNIIQQQYDIPYTSAFSLWRKIELIRPQQMQIVITFSKIKINEPVKLPFTVKD